MARKRKAEHGGRREGAGRKPTLDKPSPTIIRLEARQLEAIDRYGRDRKIPNRSAALRAIVDEVTNPNSEESDNDGAKS